MTSDKNEIAARSTNAGLFFLALVAGDWKILLGTVFVMYSSIAFDLLVDYWRTRNDK